VAAQCAGVVRTAGEPRHGFGHALTSPHQPVRGRLPDLFFVRREREHLITSKATLGPPDLVMELVSPNNRRADINATEADYRNLGVGEIVYIDQPRRRVRVLRKTDTGYEEQTLSSGQPLMLHSLGGLTLQWDWLFVEPRPDEMDTVLSLLAERST